MMSGGVMAGVAGAFGITWWMMKFVTLSSAGRRPDHFGSRA